MRLYKEDAFCDVYGYTLNNLVWGHFLENRGVGVAVGDMAKELGISRPKAYQIINEFVKKGYVIKSRTLGKTQLYKLNNDNYVVKIYIRNFKECLKMVIEEYKTKKNHSGNISIATNAKTL
ncbi:MAG: winged helix-turn-helix domain-containing protein [Candidatus Woesearchaeota archaeon]